MAIDKALYELPQGLAGIQEGPPIEIEIEDPEAVTIGIGNLEIELKREEDELTKNKFVL